MVYLYRYTMTMYRLSRVQVGLAISFRSLLFLFSPGRLFLSFALRPSLRFFLFCAPFCLLALSPTGSARFDLVPLSSLKLNSVSMFCTFSFPLAARSFSIRATFSSLFLSLPPSRARLFRSPIRAFVSLDTSSLQDLAR